MLQGSKPDPRSLRAHLGKDALCLWPFGDMWGSGSLGVLTVATLLRTASSPHCPLTWVQFLIVWGRAPPPHPQYFLTMPGLGFPTTSSVEQSRLLLGPGLPEVYPPGSRKSLSLHIADHFQREAGGMVMQRGQGRGGLLTIQGLVLCSIWPLAHLFCALVTYESPSPVPVCSRHSLLSCWHSGFCSAGSGTLVWDHPLSPWLPLHTSQSCLPGLEPPR